MSTSVRICFALDADVFAALAAMADGRRVDLRDLAAQLIANGVACGLENKSNADEVIGAASPLRAGNGVKSIITPSRSARNERRRVDTP